MEFVEKAEYVFPKPILDFNLGHRVAIVLGEEELSHLERSYYKMKLYGSIYLVASDKMSIEVYNESIKLGFNDEEVLGCVIGYPVECAKWFAKASREELSNSGVMMSGSYTFKCPEHLVDYAKEYMLEHYGLKAYYDIPCEKIVTFS